MTARWGATSTLLAALALLAPAATATAASPLPEGRVFERVSPADTGGTAAIQENGGFATILDEDTVLFGSGVVPFETDSPGGDNPTFVARRGPLGWESTPLTPTSSDAYNDQYALADTTPDLSASVWFVGPAVSFASPPPPFPGHFRLRYRDAAGNFSTLAETTEGGPYFGEPPMYGGMSQDGRTIVYSSRTAPAGLTEPKGLRKVYRWHPDGSAEAVVPAAGPLADCNVEIAGNNNAATVAVNSSSTNNVSTDGQTVFLQSGETPEAPPECPDEFAETQVYVSRGGKVTLISKVEGESGVKEGQASALFAGATADGRTAYFETRESLTAEDTEPGQPNLWRWRAEPPAGSSPLTCLSCQVPNPPGRSGGAVLSRDGAYVYYVTFEQGAAGEVGVLDVLHEGVVEKVPGVSAPLAMNRAGDVAVVSQGPGHGEFGLALDRLVLTAAGPQIEPLAHDAAGEVASGSVEGLHFHTLAAHPVSPMGAAGFSGTLQGSVSEDGRTIVFESSEELAPGGVEGGRNIYRWHDGEVAYLGPSDHGLGVSLSPDGSNILFVSPEPLTEDTVQQSPTLYDARVGGGFPRPAPTVPCDSPAACQGPPSVSAAAPEPAGGNGSGNPPSKVLVLQRPGRHALAAASRSGELVLRLRAGGGGVLSATARTRIGARSRAVASARAEVGADTSSAILRLKLDPAARHRLDEAGRLPLHIAVTLPGAGSRTANVVLKEGASR